MAPAVNAGGDVAQKPEGSLTRSPAFDPSELIEDFEYPICTFCVGVGHVRDERGVDMIPCSYCEGTGRAPK